jgi:hypothetical protein
MCILVEVLRHGQDAQKGVFDDCSRACQEEGARHALRGTRELRSQLVRRSQDLDEQEPSPGDALRAVAVPAGSCIFVLLIS